MCDLGFCFCSVRMHYAPTVCIKNMLLQSIFMSPFQYLCCNWSFADSVGWYQGSSELNCGILVALSYDLYAHCDSAFDVNDISSARTWSRVLLLESLLIEKTSHVLNNELSLYLVNCTLRPSVATWSTVVSLVVCFLILLLYIRA